MRGSFSTLLCHSWLLARRIVQIDISFYIVLVVPNNMLLWYSSSIRGLRLWSGTLLNCDVITLPLSCLYSSTYDLVFDIIEL